MLVFEILYFGEEFSDRFVHISKVKKKNQISMFFDKVHRFQILSIKGFFFEKFSVSCNLKKLNKGNVLVDWTASG